MDVRRREQLITLIMALGVTAVFAVIMMLPGTSRLSRLRSENRTLIQEQQLFAEEYGRLAPVLAAEIARLESQVAEAVRRVPPADIRVDYEQDLRAFRVIRDQSGFVGAAVDLPAAPLPPRDPAQQPAPPAATPDPTQPSVSPLQAPAILSVPPGTVVQPPGGISNPSPPAPTRP